jgi:hypothetical protein
VLFFVAQKTFVRVVTLTGTGGRRGLLVAGSDSIRQSSAHECNWNSV